MQEDEQDAQWTDVFHQQQVEVKQALVAQRTPVGELVANNIPRSEPANIDAREEAHDR